MSIETIKRKIFDIEQSLKEKEYRIKDIQKEMIEDQKVLLKLNNELKDLEGYDTDESEKLPEVTENDLNDSLQGLVKDEEDLPGTLVDEEEIKEEVEEKSVEEDLPETLVDEEEIKEEVEEKSVEEEIKEESIDRIEILKKYNKKELKNICKNNKIKKIKNLTEDQLIIEIIEFEKEKNIEIDFEKDKIKIKKNSSKKKKNKKEKTKKKKNKENKNEENKNEENENNEERVNIFTDLKVKELKLLCKNNKIKKYSKLKKDAIIKLILDFEKENGEININN
jgi:hypothetical protein